MAYAIRACLIPLLSLLGCGGCGSQKGVSSNGPTDDGAVAADASPPPPDSGAVCTAGGPQPVTFTTDDGVTLAADLYTTGKTGGAAVILLHMVPPQNDRTNYPPEFITALVGRGLTVLNVDRRGAGDSGGVALDAYKGPKGKLDAKAAQAFLLAHPCAPGPTRIAFVGASNGTTTALDFTVFAAGDATVPVPAALVFLTGGTYTENQNAMSANRAVLDRLPILFVFSTAERAWSAPFETNAPAAWQFKEYNPGGHGTRMFQAQPRSIDDVAGFLAGALK